MNLRRPFVIAINSVSGGGKTTVSRLVHERLAATLFCFDDFDDTNVHPESMYEWFRRGADPTEFDCPGMTRAVEAALRDETVAHIVLDYPFGREHPRFRNVIDLSVFIDTPLDVAMARRILRDCTLDDGVAAEDRVHQLRSEMAHYLERARYPYLECYKHRDTADLVLDGWNRPEALRDEVVARIPVDSPRPDLVP